MVSFIPFQSTCQNANKWLFLEYFRDRVFHPQGSKIGPRMYSDYVRPLGRLLTALNLWYHAYADDTQASKSARAKDENDQKLTIARLQSGIQSVSEWMFQNKLKINQEKTEFLIIASKHNQRHIAVDHMVLDGNVINRAEHARNLGVTFDSELNIQKHINEIRRRCFCDLKWIWSIRKYMSRETTKSMP